MAWGGDTRTVATSAAGAAASLRPLTIGELFDRAFNIFFRNFLTFSAILLVIILPLAVMQFFVYKDTISAEFDLFNSMIQHPGVPPDPSKLEAMNANPFLTLGLESLYGGLAFFLVPLANAAIVAGISRAYLGMQVRFADCYRQAFQRWGWVLLLVMLWAVVIVFVMFVAIIGLVFLTAGLAVLASYGQTPGVIIASVIGGVLFLALVAAAIMLYMAYASSFIATVLEKVDPIRGFALGTSRIFGGGQFWRSFWVAVALAFIGLAVALVAAAAGGLVAYLLKSPMLYLVVGNIAQIFWIALAFAVVALYYYDIRIRREGFDLQLLASQIEGSEHTAQPLTPAT